MDAHIINLPKHLDDRGNLSYIQNTTHLPFDIRRVYWIYDVPGGEARGGHAFRNTEEFIVALSGSFDVVVDDGKTRQVFSLNRSYYGKMRKKTRKQRIKSAVKIKMIEKIKNRYAQELDLDK